MVETAIILALSVPAVVAAYIGFQLKDKHSSMKMLFVSTSLIFLLGVPLTGWKLASESGYPGIASYFLGFELAIIMVFVVFVFYLIYTYLRATILVTSGTEKTFDQGEL